VNSQLGDVVREMVEQTLNKMLDADADGPCGAKRCVRSPDRIDTRAGYYERTLESHAGRASLNLPFPRNHKTLLCSTMKMHSIIPLAMA